MAKVGWFIYKLLLNPNGGATKFFLISFTRTCHQGLLEARWSDSWETQSFGRTCEKTSTLKRSKMMLQHDKQKWCWNEAVWNWVTSFLQLNSIFLALTCVKKVRWAGNSSPISVPEILSSWDHLRPRHWWIRRDSCGEFQCRARSGIHVGNLSLCFGSGCFLIYIHIYIYSIYIQYVYIYIQYVSADCRLQYGLYLHVRSGWRPHWLYSFSFLVASKIVEETSELLEALWGEFPWWVECVTEQSFRRLHVVDTDSRSARLHTQTMNHSRQAGAEHLWQQVLH